MPAERRFRAMPAERRFRAMGSDAHVIVLGGPHDLVDRAQRRIGDLEQRWSRFLPSSEVSLLNDRAGQWVMVSPDTALLVQRAIDAWWMSAGRVDATVLGDMLRAGYDRSFDELQSAPSLGVSALMLGCADIDLSGNEVRLPRRTGFDPGGIGKGLAADLVAAEAITAGAAGVCINLGGDVRVAGAGPDGDGWTVAIEHPELVEPIARLGVRDGAVATSSTLRRRWLRRDVPVHHLIDPMTGQPSTTDLTLATVVAADAWTAEVLAKSVLLRGAAHPFDLVEGTGAEALAVTTDGHITATRGFLAFLSGVALPDHLAACASRDEAHHE
jgi:FAD:protein FMN transferase